MTSTQAVSRPLAASRSEAVWRVRQRLPALACVAVAAAAASVGITNEGYVSTSGDMPRYLMNGVFMLDLLRDHPFGSLDSLIEYARLYYARYPALSIGHHPLLVSVAEVPSYALFGVSVLAGRLPVIILFAAGALYLCTLVSEWYDEWAGAAAALALATSPLLVSLSQSVMSEPPAVALLIMAAWYLHRYCATGRRRALVLFVLCAGASVWAKQLAIAVFPAFALYAGARLGVRRLFSRDLIAAGVALVVIVAPLIPLTLAMSPANVGIITSGPQGAAVGGNWRLIRSLAEALFTQFAAPMAAAAVAGVAVVAWRRRPEAWLLFPWIAGVGIVVFLGTRFVEVPRYSLFWTPAWAAAIGALFGGGRQRRLVLVAMVAVLVGVQGSRLVRSSLPGAGGYEAAAQYVVDHPYGSTVLFSGDVDTGFFVFFVRKHDEARRLVVLRADKILTTSRLDNPAVEDRIERPEAIRPILAELGVGYVVIEDRPSESKVLEWLRSELTSDAYVERLRVPFESTDARLRGTDLVVYQVRDAPAHAPDARVDVRLPVISTEVDVALADLVNRKYLR
jgi:hypothetical protein